MNLVLDIGNSSAKFASFVNEQMQGEIGVIAHDDIPRIIREIDPNNLLISSVGPFKDSIPEVKGTLINLTKDTRLPITINYKTPESLGVDRVAAAVGASVLLPGKDSLIIDAGSCITYDILERGSVYQGGIISPGLRLRAEAMHNLTRDLPLIDSQQPMESEIPLIGKSTIGSMKSGLINGMVLEIDGLIDQYLQIYPEIQVFLCGGEAKHFEKRLKADIFAVPKLVLVGLNKILEHNIADESVR